MRLLLALLMGAAILAVGIAWMRSLVSHPPPPDPDAVDVSAAGLKFVCTMCGLELRIEKAARDKPPTHCAEPMVLIREGSPPLEG